MSIHRTPGQSAGLSPQADAFLEAATTITVAAEQLELAASPENVLAMREQFVAGERPVEDAIIARHDLALEPGTLGGVAVLHITPSDVSPGLENAVLLNIHGGGFVMGDARDRNALLMAAELRVRVVSVDYTNAPEAHAPVPVEQSLAVYRELVRMYRPDRVVGMSSSGGGSVMLAMLQAALGGGLPMPAALGLFTPAADISGVGDSVVFNNDRDVMSADFAMAIAHEDYTVGIDPADPQVSPLYGSFVGFPPCIISVGTRDIMLSNGARLMWAMREAGVPVELLVTDGMWHGFQWEPDLPEAIRVRRAFVEFLTTQLM